MNDDFLLDQRRGFLGSMAAATAAAMGGLAIPAAQAHEPATGDTDFTRWLDSIPGKYRQLYDAPEVNGGLALMWSYVFKMTAAQAYGLPESDIGVVVALRHATLPLAMGDATWEKYKFGEFFGITDPQTKTPALRNPFANLKPGDLPLPDAAIEKLIARGVKFVTCAMAIHHYSLRYAAQHGGDAAAIEKDWHAGVMPGVFVAPSGVVAVHGAQTRGCTYVFAG